MLHGLRRQRQYDQQNQCDNDFTRVFHKKLSMVEGSGYKQDLQN
jgi:plasmid maintenance system killer protein